MPHTFERAPTGRTYYEEGRFVPSGFIHAGCATDYFGTADILWRLRHFSPGLSDPETDEIEKEIKPEPRT